MPTRLQLIKSDLFRALAHPIRIGLCECLAAGERTVFQMQEELDLDQPVVSQHLAALRAKNLVVVRRQGTQAFYMLRNPLVADLLRVARELLSDHLTEHQAMLRELQREEQRAARRSR